MANYGPTPTVAVTPPLVRHVHGGETIDFIPAAGTDYGNGVGGGVLAGYVVVINSMVGIALRTIVAGEQGSLAIEGCFEFPKAASDGGMASGSVAYWDATNLVATGTAGSNVYLGKVEPPGAATADTSVRISVEAIANASGTIGFTNLPSATVAAAGTAQSDAAVIGLGFTLVSAADGTKGVILPTAAAGKVCIIKNIDAANAILKVYPASGDAINAIAANSPLSMAAKTSMVVVAYDATTWYTIPLLPS